MPEQHPVDTEGASVVGHVDDVARRVEHPLQQEAMLPRRLVEGDLHECAHLVESGARLGDEKGAPEPELDVASNIVADRGLVQRPEIRRI